MNDAPKRHAPRGPVKRAVDPLSGADPLSVKCSARSKRTGKQCGQWAIPGGTVCKWHGGAAPQVKAAAMERLMALQHPAIDRLTKLIAQDAFPTVAYAASKDVLDRTMGRARENVDRTVTDASGLRSKLEAGRKRVAAARTRG